MAVQLSTTITTTTYDIDPPVRVKDKVLARRVVVTEADGRLAELGGVVYQGQLIKANGEVSESRDGYYTDAGQFARQHLGMTIPE